MMCHDADCLDVRCKASMEASTVMNGKAVETLFTRLQRAGVLAQESEDDQQWGDWQHSKFKLDFVSKVQNPSPVAAQSMLV
eukprot:1150333-Pelagomonas_calceolata.AAC.3